MNREDMDYDDKPSSPRPTSPSHATEGSRLKRKSPTGPPRGDAEREDSGSKRRRKDDSLSPAHDYVPLKRGERSSPPPRPSPLERRKTVTQEEKKRGRRLFGGLLSTLSQKTTNTHQKRREEIERRQAERARQQEAEKEQFRAERAAKVRAIRRAEQVRFDEDMIRARHRHDLAMARFLKTKAQPPIYYLPYELTREQEDDIDDEIQRVEDMVDDELVALRRRKSERLKGRRTPETPTASTLPDEPSKGAIKPLSPPPDDGDQEKRGITPSSAGDGPKGRVRDSADAQTRQSKDQNHHHHHDDGDVVENAEDTVIY